MIIIQIDNQHFFDLSLIYEDEKTRNTQLRSLNTIIIRYISELNSLYEKYHNYHPRENKITKNYTLSYIQLWKLIEDCEISKNSNHTIVEMNREFAKIFKDKKHLNYKFHELHNENQILTIHDFYEYLIHVSYLLYSDIEIPSINEDGISVCFSHFIKTNILPYIKNESTIDDTNMNNLGSYIFQNIKDKYGKTIYDIYKDHSYCHKDSLKSSKGDFTLNIRDIIFILKDYEILDEEILTVGMVIKIFSTYFIPGINQDGVFNFDYEILPYEFMRFLFYCMIVKYCPDEHYIRLKRNKFYNENISQSKIELLQKEDENMSTTNIKNDVSSNTSNSNTANIKKIENNNITTTTADKVTGNKKGIIDTQDINSKSRSSNISAQKKKQNSTPVINETPDKSESATKNIRKTVNSVNPPTLDDKNNDNNKKDITPATVKDNLNESSTNESLEQSEDDVKPETNNTLKYKFFEFPDEKDPKYIISTFMSKLSISKKEDYCNDSTVKLDDNTSDTEEEDENKIAKDLKETVLTIIDINKLDPEVQEWMLTDIENIFDTFSTKLEYFKKRNENQRLAMLSYYNEVKEKQIQIKRMREEQINLNKKLQNEIINSKWVTENMSKFDEVTNDNNTETITTTNPITTNTNLQAPIPQPSQAQTQVLSHQDSHQQTPPPLQNKIASSVSLSGNKNDNKNSPNLNQDNQNIQ
ncbi:hypothetical protein H8356DRAFT_933312 [Neocallimastix lanati (nom. inval.)]|uniref:Uncharacterized protein n=1 Tax=Neocallimastix californiae TaxID=1754190 RepID=A0A1Y2FJ62_9FUNG|nr:hypothetical protein H8356DRAFT_933312 [Neocallimastix sp. JGI-2020a]ORY84012.1 hypothetical protein LY90DRAFT_499446 [Neocallimastix californiae]|eukprot:ORY84012.1 hypothetical protein LY90DRAFT_499446 [Neocallimastix californiae]